MPFPLACRCCQCWPLFSAECRHAAGVDSSGPALELARRNAALNGVAENVCSFEQADVSDFMKQALADGRQWDLVRFLLLLGWLPRHCMTCAQHVMSASPVMMMMPVDHCR